MTLQLGMQICTHIVHSSNWRAPIITTRDENVERNMATAGPGTGESLNGRRLATRVAIHSQKHI